MEVQPNEIKYPVQRRSDKKRKRTLKIFGYTGPRSRQDWIDFWFELRFAGAQLSRDIGAFGIIITFLPLISGLYYGLLHQERLDHAVESILYLVHDFPPIFAVYILGLVGTMLMPKHTNRRFRWFRPF